MLRSRWKAALAAFGLTAAAAASVVAVTPQAAHAADVSVYNNGTLAAGWQNWSWNCGGCAPSSIQAGGPIVNDLGNWGGLYLTAPGTASLAPTATLSFKVTRLTATANFLNTVLVRNDGYGSRPFPTVAVPTTGLTADAQGFVSISMPMASLNPSGLNFDGIQIMTSTAWPAGSLVRFNTIAVTGAPTVTTVPVTRAGASASPASAAATATVNCASTMPISPRVYGVAYDSLKDSKVAGTDDPAQWSVGATSRRWGGNPTSRFNPSLNAWNLDNDWYFENIAPSRTWQQFVSANTARNVGGVVSVPTLGWVAKDTTSNGFPVSVYGSQESTDSFRPAAGNGRANGQNLTVTQPPTLTSAAFPPASAGAWVGQLKAAAAAPGRIDHYVLDNEPDLWSDTHRDVRTAPLHASELVQNNRDYATAIRQADSTAKIAGPAISGMFGMKFSDFDNRNGYYSGQAGSDRAAMGGKDLGQWYLEQMKAAENASGVKLLDLVDLHYYPQSANVYGGGFGGLDLATSQLRIRSTRSLWDPTYVDESWYGQAGNPPVNLLPTLQGWINGAYPGLGISIGEYSFGAEDHMSGAVAEAEALGRFGQAITVGTQRYAGAESAYYWTYPSENTPLYWAMRGYRNFDGAGGGFGDVSLATTVSPAVTSASPLVSVFGSRRTASGDLVAAVLNLTADKSVTTTLSLAGCSTMGTATPYVYDGTANGYTAQATKTVGGQQVAITSAPWSITFVRFAAATTSTPPVNTALPTVSGTAQVTRTLTATSGTWTGTAPISYAYQWQRCTSATACTNIAGATASTYTLVAADQGRTVRVRVTATNAAGSASVNSAATATVTAPPTLVKPTATNTGVPAGTTLTTYTGPTTITTAGTVIDAKTITQPITIAANNVTITRSSVSASNWVLVLINAGVTGTRLEDVAITGGGSGFCVSGSSVTIVRARITGCDNALATSSGATVDGSYLVGNTGAAVSTFYGVNASNLVLRGNTIVAPATTSFALNLAEPAPNTVTSVTVTGNWLDGGAYTVNVDGTAVTFQDNRFGRAGTSGPKYPFTVNPLTGTGNVWDDTGLPVPGF